MTTATDRLSGLTTSVAIKPPCKAVAIANITLSGEQTVNGVACVDGDRVLVTAQTSGVDSGIYVCATSAWARAKDFDGSRDVVTGTLVLTEPGTGTAQMWEVTTAGAITIGTTSITFVQHTPEELALRSDLASTASTALGDALWGLKRTATGAVATTGHAWHDGQAFNVKTDFGATGDGTTNDATAIAAAIAAAGALILGGAVYFPPGVYVSTATTFDIPDNVKLYGEGQRASTILFKGTGNGFTSLGTINSPANMRLVIRDLGIICDNASNTGSGLLQMGGLLCELSNTYFYGFKYGAALVQTELAIIDDQCLFDTQLTTGLWLVNGGDHPSYPTASLYFTNRITCRANFNQSATAYCVVDDGGLCHNYDGCNFNGGIRSLRIAGVTTCIVGGACEFELATQENILIAATTLAGTAVIPPASVHVSDNLFIPVATKSAIVVSSGASLVLTNNQFSNSLSAAASVVITTLNSLIAIGNYNPNAYTLGATAFYRIMDIYASGALIMGNLGFVGLGFVVPTLTITANVLTPLCMTSFLGAGLVKTITLPAGFPPGGSITLIPTAAFTTDATGNVAIASTAVTGRAMTFTWDSTGSKWYPSY